MMDSATSHVVPTPTPDSLPPLHISSRHPAPPSPPPPLSIGDDSGSEHSALLILIPVGLVALVVVAVFGVYKWKQWGWRESGSREGSLCWPWRRRIGRRRSPAHFGSRITTLGKLYKPRRDWVIIDVISSCRRRFYFHAG